LRVAAYSDGHGILLDWHGRRALERSAAEWKELVPELRVKGPCSSSLELSQVIQNTYFSS
jgi:hypothetical protein